MWSFWVIGVSTQSTKVNEKLDPQAFDFIGLFSIFWLKGLWAWQQNTGLTLGTLFSQLIERIHSLEFGFEPGNFTFQ